MLAQGGGALPFDAPVETRLADGATHTYTFRSEGSETLSVEMQAVPEDGRAAARSGPGALRAGWAVGGLQRRSARRQRQRAGRCPGRRAAGRERGLYPGGASYGKRGAGTYRLTASREPLLSLDGSAPIALGESIQAEIFVAGQVDRWTFQGEAGQTVRIGMRHAAGSQLDPLLELLGPDGTTLITSDDDGGDVDSLIAAFTLPLDGPYVIVARGWGSLSVGEYDCRWKRST